MAKKKEEEKKKKLSLPKLAAGLGIGYVAYKNRNTLIGGVKKVLGKGNVTLSRAASGTKYQGAMKETKNLWSGVLETYGDMSPKNILKTFTRDPEIRSKSLQRNIMARNKNLVKELNNRAPKDVKRGIDILRGRNRSTGRQAMVTANLANVEEILKNKKFQDAFGDNVDNVKSVLKRNPSLFRYQQGQMGKDGVEEVSPALVKLFHEYNHNPEKTVNFNIPSEDKHSQQRFVANLMELVKETSQKTESQRIAFEKTGKSIGNAYGSAKNLYDITLFEGERQARKPARDFLTDGIRKQGFHEVTMEEARKLTVQQDKGGRFFLNEEGESIDRLFGTKSTGLNGVQNNSLVASWYSTGEKLGVPRQELQKDLFSSELFLNKQTGELISTTHLKEEVESAADFIQNNIQVPFLSLNPMDLTQRRSRKANQMTQNSWVFQPNSFLHLMDSEGITTQKSLDARNLNAFGKRTDNVYIQMGEELLDGALGEAISSGSPAESYQKFLSKKEEYVLETGIRRVNTNTGIFSQYAEAVSGRTNRSVDEQGGALKRVLGLGQEEESIFGRMKRAWTKFEDPHYGGNIADFLNLSADLKSVDAFEEGIDRAYGNLYGRTRNLSTDSKGVLYDDFNKVLNKHLQAMEPVDLFDAQTDEGALKIAEVISERFKNIPNKKNDVVSSVRQSLEKEIHDLYNYNFLDNQEGFLDGKRFLKNRNVLQNTLGEAFADTGGGRGVSSTDDLRRLIEQYSISLADEQGLDLLNTVAKSGGIYQTDVLREVDQLRGLSQVGHFKKDLTRANSYDKKLASMAEYRDFFQEEGKAFENLKVTMKELDPWYGTGIGEKQESLLDSNYTLIKKHRGLLEAVNKNLQDASFDLPDGTPEQVGQAMAIASGIFEYGKEFGSSMLAKPGGNVTEATVLPWFFANRLDRGVQELGLGLPNRLKGSATSIIGNQWARRIVLPYVAYQTAMYVDGLTNDFFSDSAADAYVNMHQDVNSFKEKLGINAMGREFQRMTPWADQIKEWGGVKQLNFLTMGAFSDFRSPEDVREYYESGEDPIRKGRYWGIGSNSAWEGGKIDRYEPNWYRKMKSDYLFTEDVYGSEKEYWKNHWMPTPTNPLAPVRHFITDPYHYEDKHAESRPYAITGGFNELQQIPLAGPAVNSVVSSVLKPQRVNPRLAQSHREYLSQYNERLASAYINMNAGGVVNIGPSGSISLSSDSYNVNMEDTKDEYGMVDEESLVANEMAYNAGRDRMAVSLLNNSGIIPQVIANGGTPAGVLPNSGVLTTSDMSNYFLAQMNKGLTDSKTTSRSDQVSTAGTLHSPGRVQNLSSVINQQSLLSKDGVIRDVTYNAGEMAGMYGFLSKTAFGFEESGRGATLQSSQLFGSYNRSFWDKELGGLGGNLSEIGRRYLPRDPNRNYYNPIKNTMPEWLPGPEYFTDFLHGDPFSRIASGEMRLPSSAYEALYSVRKDAYGNYSALDRYRILADVAPYSDQYRAAKKEVSLLNQNGYLDEKQQKEYATIRKQTSSRMKKKNFSPERFQNAEVQYEDVTVTHVIDANTFLTKEYDQNPFKFAGVQVKADDKENKELISQFIRPGQKLKVAIDADAKKRIRDDMMDTMRVVVFTPRSEKGSMMGLNGIGAGANLNYHLARQSEEFGGEGSVTIKDDETAVSTHALYSRGQLTTGKWMEQVVHNVLPNVPVVNILADKFLPAKSAVESYEKELYSKSWRDWKNPISDWMMPMIESTANRNPIFSGLNGLGIGLLAGSRSAYKWNIGWGTAAVFATLSGGRALLEGGKDLISTTTGIESEKWIPKRRKKEREIDEYFDKIKYVKYKGLYEQAKIKAREEEGFDLDKFFENRDEQGSANKNLSAYLNHRKKWLTIEKKTSEGETPYIDHQLEMIKESLNEIDSDRPSGRVGSYTALALRYKDEYESTLYGAEETHNYNQIYRALPKKDKEYFTAFQKASPKERNQIIKLVPKNQRRIYQMQFGMKVDEKESLENYFVKKNLPGKNWEGWDPSVSLDNIKIKVMEAEAIDLTEANYWDEDKRIADESGAEAIPVNLTPFVNNLVNSGDLEKILRGTGLKDVRIQMKTSAAENNSFSTRLNIEQDRTKEIEQGIRERMNYF